jgi:hypothetical protein
MMEVSRVELPTGQVVTVEHPEEWPEYKVKAFAELNAPAATRTQSTEGTDNKDDEVTTGDLVKLGLSRFAVQFIPDTFLISNEDLFKVENAGVTQERAARRMAGVPAEAELGFGQEMIAGLSDPFTLTGVPVKQGVGAFMKALVPAVTSTVSGTATGLAVPQVVKELGGGELAQEMSAALAGGLVSTGAGVGTSAALSTGLKVAGDIKNKVIGGETGTLGVASDAMANSRVRAEINRIKSTSTEEEVTRAVENLANIKEEIPDLEIGGLVATLVENPIVRDWVRKTTQNNKGFQKDLVEKIARDATKVSEKFDEYMPVSEEIDRTIIEGIAVKQKTKVENALRSNLERKNANIDNVLSGLTFKVVGEKDVIDVGRVATKLLARKESNVRQAANQLYTLAEKQGSKVVLAETEVANVYNLFRGARLADIFGPESTVAKKLESKWSPKEIEGEGGVKSLEMPEVTGNDLISLKKGINRELSLLFRVRDKSTDVSQRISRLYSLKEVVDSTLVRQSGESPKFVQAVRDADAFYYQELGLPLKAEGMREIKSRKFESGAATSLMNYEQAKDYVNFVGKPGMAVVRHAVRLKAEKSVLTNGQLNQSKLDNFIRKNRRLIEFAGLTDELSVASSKLKTIKNTQARHTQAYNEKSLELTRGFYKAVQEKNLSTVVAEMINQPGQRKRYLQDIKKLDQGQQDMVMTGLRQEFLAQAVSSKGSMQDFMNKNADAAVDLFDSKYVSNINKLAGLADLLTRMSGLLKDSLGETGVIDTAQDVTGVSYAEYVGTLRNQILSAERKFINLISKSVVSKGKDKYYVKSAEVLLDPDVVEKLANPPKGDMEAWVKSTLQGAGDYLKDVGAYFTDVLNSNLSLATLRTLGAISDVPTPDEQKQLEATGGQQ